MSLIKCQECGAKISDKSGKCVKCGCPIEKTQVQANLVVPATFFCAHCGKKDTGDRSECIYCGKIISDLPVSYCRYCGTETGIFTDQDKCKKCGRELATQEEESVDNSLIIHERSGCLPIIGSLLFPGLGHLMRGEVVSGIVFFLFAVVMGISTYGIGYLGMSLLSALAVAFSSVPKCPKCKGIVHEDAVKCKYCQSDLFSDEE